MARVQVPGGQRSALEFLRPFLFCRHHETFSLLLLGYWGAGSCRGSAHCSMNKALLLTGDSVQALGFARHCVYLGYLALQN